MFECIKFNHNRSARDRGDDRGSGRGRDRDRRESMREEWINGFHGNHMAKDYPNPSGEDPSMRRLCYHLRQNHHRIEVVKESDLQRILPDDAPREKYRRRAQDIKTVNHWGQRKLLMSEVEFLTEFGFENSTEETIVVYAGAAPGAHTKFLAHLFPKLKFYLVDPTPFNASVKGQEQIVVWQEFFNEEKCDKIRDLHPDARILFISDVRTADWKVMDEEEVEDAVYSDTQMQQEWVLLLKPAHSMLKFRLPWGNGHTKYLAGDIYLPVWGPVTTTETRLVAHGYEDFHEWDHRKYEEQLFYFNTRTRVNYYEHDVEMEGLCHCFDCASEVRIWKRYLLKSPGWYEPQEEDVGPFVTACDGTVIPEKELHMEVARRAEITSKECSHSSGRTLGTVMDPPNKRKQWFKGRRFDSKSEKIVDQPDSIVAATMERKREDLTSYKRKDRTNVDSGNEPLTKKRRT